MNSVKNALDLKLELDNLRPIDQDQEKRIMDKFRLDWNYHSNNLEGNSLTYGETKAFLLHGITASGKPFKDYVEVLGHNEAINWVIDIVNEDHPLTENFIRQLHNLLLKESYEVKTQTADGKPTKKTIHVGQYKTSSNHVETKTGEILRFAEPHETPAKMHDLMEWFRKEKEDEDVNPIILAALFHYKFVRIHPFDDGNGRVARILMNFILMQFGYPPIIIKTQDKDGYLSVLMQADAGLMDPFIEYVAKNLVRSLEIMIKGAKGDNIEEEEDIDKEIALLVQKFKHLNKEEKNATPKSEELVLKIYDDSIFRLYKSFVDYCKKFEGAYRGCKLFISGSYADNLTEDGTKKAFDKTRNYVCDYNKIVLGCDFHEAGGKDYNSVIKITFAPYRYFIKTYSADINCNIDKSYEDKISDEEIKKIIKSLKEEHKKFIEQKVA